MEDFTQLKALLVSLFGLVILVVGIRIAAGAKKAQYADTARTSVNAGVSMVFVAIGLGALGFAAFGGQILDALGLTS